MPPVIVIVVAAVAVAVVILMSVRALRSRSARSDWIGELSEIRRSSLGDDQEVTGALETVKVIADDAFAGEPVVDSPSEPRADSQPGSERDSEPGPEVDPESERDRVPDSEPDLADGSERYAEADSDVEPEPSPVSVTDAPRRTVTDAGTLFNEYDWPGFGMLRVEATDPLGLRVLLDAASSENQVLVDLPRGVAWFRSPPSRNGDSCTVRTPDGWVTGRGTLLVLVDSADLAYAMCLEGDASARSARGGRWTAFGAGSIARISSDEVGVIDLEPSVLEGEDVVRRQRRLDGTDPDSYAIGAP